MLYRKIFKPLLDRVLALVAVILLCPLFLLIILAVKINSKGPAFFLQERLGKQGKVFKLIKFRSMTIHQGETLSGHLLFEDDPRITRVGRFIRKTSLDEIPQLFNILRGEMSFIGPRPPQVHFPKPIDEYNSLEIRRFHVKPGIGGLAQVRCREIHDWNINIPIDVEYVESMSFMLDVRLFFSSLFSFFKTDNIYTPKGTI